MSDPGASPRTGAAPDAGDASAQAWTAPLRPVLAFLAIPGVLGFAILALGVNLPSIVLYGIAGALGLALLARTFRDPETLLAVFIVYVPLMKLFVVPIAPGINGTNALLGLMLIAWASRASRERRPLFVRRPNSRLVGLWCGVTLISVLTTGFTFGWEVVGGVAGDVKGWLDNFVVFFAFLHLIRDGAMARRVFVYMMLGAVVVLALGGQEWLDKRFMDSIDKARLLGPQLQPNDLGAFLVYSAGPFLGLFVTQLSRVRAWVLVPYFVLLARILVATFSRGAFIGMAVAGVAAGYVRGRAFLLVTGLIAAAMLVAMPQLVPASLSERMGNTTAGEGEELDTSSQTRLILWKAAVAMSLESPVLGKGFKAFPRLKGDYTEVEVHESDNHNMFLWIASQMGIPALLMFLWLLLRTYLLAARIFRAGGDPFRRAVSLGAAATVPGLVAVNMFGSRMTDIAVDAYFWIMLAALAHLWLEIEPGQPDRRAARAPWPAAAGGAGAVRGGRSPSRPGTRRPRGTPPSSSRAR